MSSIIEGYNYDIFISYRQKDNKGDRWVSEFVDSLKTELESTFKEEISVYFDINPHDGLLETHDVDASLKEKLNCLIFIPIISRTYCDPKSFAWEHEFKAFVEQASKDQFGLKVKLPNGNVSSRVLPIRIYDLDNNDIKLCESLLGGVLRSIEFIYAEPGVNRPLKPGDSEEKNTNNTNYRNQTNKIGNAIKEIISGLKAEPVEPVKEKIRRREPSEEIHKKQPTETQAKPFKSAISKLFLVIIIMTLLVIAAKIAYPKMFKRNSLEKLQTSGERISVAVMPFQNITNDTTWNIWQKGFQENLITYLSNFLDELAVKQPESVNTLIQSKGYTDYASITPSVGRSISQKLDADVFICGSIQHAGAVLRVNAKLIDSETNEILKSFEIDGTFNEETIFYITDSIRKKVTDFLLISKLVKKVPGDFRSFTTTESPEAYKYFICGNSSFINCDYSTAVKWYLRSIESDSNFIFASYMLATAYANQGLTHLARKWSIRIYQKRDQVPLPQKLLINSMYATFFETPVEDIGYLKQLLEIDDQQPIFHSLLGGVYYSLHQYDNAVMEFEKVFAIYKKWKTKPMVLFYYNELGMAYHMIGDYKNEELIYKKAKRNFPNDPILNWRLAVNSLTAGDTIAANKYIDKYIAFRKKNNASEATLAYIMAQIYFEANFLDLAEKYYRQALLYEPEKVNRLGSLAFFLIDKDRNISEGLDLTEKALKTVPGSYWLLDTKGWGLYKQGRYNEALEILRRSWAIRKQYEGYDHDAYLRLEAAKKAVTGQQNN